MKNTHEITEEWEWMADLDSYQINSVHQCMKEYAIQVLDEFVSIYIDDINVHDKVISLFKQNIK